MPSFVDRTDMPVEPAGCEACLRTGGRWVHLRRCLTCGHVGCCDSSEGRHATRHFHDTGHPVIESAEPGESWRWSYRERAYCEGDAPPIPTPAEGNGREGGDAAPFIG